MSQPLISVVIPTYNRERQIINAVESVNMQNYENIELLICDDFSTDNTESVIEQLQKKYNNIRFLRRGDKKKGANAARNLGIENASGKYIAFLDSDDRLLEKSLSVRVKILEENKDVVMVYGDCIINEEYFSFDKIQDYDQNRYLMEEMSLCNFSVMMVRKEIFSQIPLLNTELKSWQDDSFVLSINKMKGKIWHCGEPVCMFNVNNDDGRISSNYRNLYEGCNAMVRMYTKDIIKEVSVFRLGLWKLRVFLNYMHYKEANEQNRVKKYFMHKISGLIKLVCGKSFRHIWG